MPNALLAILLLITIFCFFLILSFLLNILYHYKANNNQFIDTNQEKEQPKSKIYYSKRVKSANSKIVKKPQIALKNKIWITTNRNDFSNN